MINGLALNEPQIARFNLTNLGHLNLASPFQISMAIKPLEKPVEPNRKKNLAKGLLAKEANGNTVNTMLKTIAGMKKAPIKEKGQIPNS